MIGYVANFVQIGSGKKFNPHVTIGVATIPYLKKMLAEPFEAFTFSLAGASVYQHGAFGTARKELKALALTQRGHSLHMQSPLLALSGHGPVHCTCPLLGVKRTSHLSGVRAALLLTRVGQ
ncbi:MAG: hypothetical protein WA754_16605 [Pseudolabrys sp.]